MNKKTATVLIGFVIFMLIASFSLLVFSQTKAYAESSTSPGSNQNDSFTPTVWKPAWVDQDNNGIADSLDQEIADRIANGTVQDYVGVTVMLKASPTTEDVDDFVSSSGYLTTDLWTKATYGFGGMITYAEIANFIQRCSDVLLVEKEAVGRACVAYAAQQVGARTYVWNTLGLQGDPNSSIAVVDAGIDGSHVDFSPGYGDQDFSKKIVGWNDQVGSTTAPVDDDGHGSHCAGLAAGNGFPSVDASGSATATYGSKLSGGGTWFGGGMMVNKTGTITINVKWMGTGTAKLSSAVLRYGDKNLNDGLWTQVASVSTPNPNTVYSITYNVASTPSGGYDMYHIMLPTTGTGDLYVTYTVSWPYMPPADGLSAWTGIAPQSKLVGVKTFPGTNNDLVDGINWIIANRMTYHITVVSISIEFSSELSDVDNVLMNLVNSGVATVVAAGNYFPGAGGNRIYSPASVDEIITVAAMNQFDDITDYSKQGGASHSTGKTTKPDITAPGGSFNSVPLFSADSNCNDAEGGFADIQANDSAPMQGTSMSAPIISGCAQVVIQAMGGYAEWNWTRSQALQPKMVLLMTATETYPNFREGGTLSTSPTLQRGGKDVHEGYGRVNLDAAVDALLTSYGIGSVVTDTLGRPPTLTDISVLGQRLAWARNVQLVSGYRYNFSLSVPAGADYDLYLYNSTGTAYGDPAIVAQSTNATTGGTEQFWVAAPYTGTYYIVVKRATENTGIGAFTLSSSSPLTVVLNTPGLPSASNVVHYVQNGVSKTGSIVASKFSDYVDTGTTLTIDNPIYVSTTQRYITTDPTSFTIQSSATFTVNYKTQYYVTVNSDHGGPTDSQWVDQGDTFTASVPSPTEQVVADSQWVCTGYSLDGGSSQSGTSYTFTNVQAAHTIVFNWKRQFYLTVNSAYGSPSGGGWFDLDATASASLSSGTVSGETGVQYVFTGWSGDASGTDLTSNGITMGGPKTATANWKTQYYLTTSSNFGSVSPDSEWHDAGSTVTISATAPSASSGEQYAWNGWTGTGSGNYVGTDNQASVTMNGAITETASWTHQYRLTVTSPYGSPAPMSSWFDAGTSIPASVSSPIAGFIVTEYVCTGWEGTGSVPASGTATSISFTIDQPSSIMWNWKTEYLVTNLLVIIIIPVALTGLAVYLLLRRRQKGKIVGGALEPTLPPPPPPPAAQKLAAPISVMRWFLLLFQREMTRARFLSVLPVLMSVLSIILVRLRSL
jgi:subtilisin family serine protease